MKYLLLFLLASCCSACNPTESSKPAGPAANGAVRAGGAPTAIPPLDTADTGRTSGQAIAGSSSDTLRVADDAFVGPVLDHALAYKRIIPNRKAFRLSYTLTPNEYAPTLRDSLNTFSDRQNSFTYYFSGDTEATGALLLKAHISAPAIKLPKNVKVGMSTAQFMAAFHLKKVPAVVVITEAEGYQVFTFTFEQARLVSIDFVSNYQG